MNVNPELVQRIANLPQENLDVREIMRLSSTASVEEITKRFREFSRKFLRPDKNPAQLEAAQKAFQKMRGAIEELERLAQQDPSARYRRCCKSDNDDGSAALERLSEFSLMASRGELSSGFTIWPDTPDKLRRALGGELPWDSRALGGELPWDITDTSVRAKALYKVNDNGFFAKLPQEQEQDDSQPATILAEKYRECVAIPEKWGDRDAGGGDDESATERARFAHFVRPSSAGRIAEGLEEIAAKPEEAGDQEWQNQKNAWEDLAKKIRYANPVATSIPEPFIQGEVSLVGGALAGAAMKGLAGAAMASVPGVAVGMAFACGLIGTGLAQENGLVRALNCADVRYLTKTILPLVEEKCNSDQTVWDVKSKIILPRLPILDRDRREETLQKPRAHAFLQTFRQKRAAGHDRAHGAQVEDAGEDEGFLDFEKEMISLLENSKELEGIADKVEDQEDQQVTTEWRAGGLARVVTSWANHHGVDVEPGAGRAAAEETEETAAIDSLDIEED